MSAETESERQWGRLVVTYALPVLTAILSTVLCLIVSERNADRGRQARLDMQRTQCALIVSLDDNYRTSPITTEVGRRNAQALARLRASQGCEPPSS